MGVLEKLCDNLITQYPTFSAWEAIALIIGIFLLSPILMYVLLSERFNKGRWLFERKSIGGGEREHLYLLDTMRGRLYWVDGKAYFSRVHPRDWKEERAEATK